jgi:2-keto-3-deoxy-L-rhamnonate aldolase RhmA
MWPQSHERAAKETGMNRNGLALAVCAATMFAIAESQTSNPESRTFAFAQSASAQPRPSLGGGGPNPEPRIVLASARGPDLSSTQGPGKPSGAPIGGTRMPAQADSRGWGWQVKATIDPATPRPLYNRAKERLLQDKQITSYTISSFDPDLYCEVGKHFDYIWFEMQHSTMSYDEVRRMLLTCPRVGAAPMVRMPDALESSIQKATDLGALGIIVPTVDDALEARDAARFSRYPPFGRRSAGGGAYRELWNVPGLNYRATINDNMLVTVMIETLEGVAMAEEIAATHGVDVVLLGNNDLSSFSGWTQHDPRYQDAIIKVHDAALKYGKYYGNAGEQYLSGYTVSADTRMVQNGPACDGWRPAGRGRGTQSAEEPVVGLPAGGRAAAPVSPAASRDRTACWP